MAFGKAQKFYAETLANLKNEGLLKEERFIHSSQAADIKVEYPEGKAPQSVINMCANNYLGLSSHPDVVAAAHTGLDSRGYGMSSVRFICGTQDIHRELEAKISNFLGMEKTILFSSCMDANAAVFESLLDNQDAIVADKLIHASLIDGVRLCKAERHIYDHSDMAVLEEKLKATQDKRFRMIVTDGVFSMDGDLAKLNEICDLAEKYDAMVLVDDSHATGFIGKTGRGTHEHFDVMGRVDIITTTLGKALGGASGGCISSSSEIVDMLRQRARTYLFSNSLPPVIVSAANKVMDIISSTTERRDKLDELTTYFRKEMVSAGFDIVPGFHPIVPIMLYNAKLSQDIAKDLYYEGIYVIGFFYPVVPKGQSRIRVQVSAAHDMEHIKKAIAAFTKVGEKYKILGKSKEEVIEMYGE
ncbi:MAG TPA: glycine C-acetyltransferase [candidate division Zixibacteria bacterium]|nr:glycine C-acetyltransferase [candidate division Zixibacteria bacterium]